MMRGGGLIALSPVLLTLCAAGTAPTVSKAFGATIVSTYPDNRQATLWLGPSGSYSALGPGGDRSTGHWKIHGRKLCLKQAHPPAPLPLFRYCTPIPSQDQWVTKAVTGETIHVRIVE